MKGSWAMGVLASAVIFVSGCVSVQRHHPDDLHKIALLQKEVDKLGALIALREKEKEGIADRLLKEKNELERSLKREIDDRILTIKHLEKGIVITFLDRILFDSGRATIREEARLTLDKVADILNTRFIDRNVNIEGHTDSEPIKYSGWKSNWELSSARALSVLHYFVDAKEMEPTRISATGWGEFSPVASNDTPEGRQENRRVEIVILPEAITKIEQE